MGQELELLKARRDRVEEQLDAATDGALEARLLLEFHSLEEGLEKMELQELAKVGRSIEAPEDLSKLTSKQLEAQAHELAEAAKGLQYLVGQPGPMTRADKDGYVIAKDEIIERGNALSAEAKARDPEADEPWRLPQEELAKKLLEKAQAGDHSQLAEMKEALQGIVNGLTVKK